MFDPASFFGHSEFELAIMDMFGGFQDPFWASYHAKVGLVHLHNISSYLISSCLMAWRRFSSRGWHFFFFLLFFLSFLFSYSGDTSDEHTQLARGKEIRRPGWRERLVLGSE